MKYQKKPKIIEAMQFRPTELPLPFADRFACRMRPDRSWYVVTIHGQETNIVDGDWIIPEPDGVHFYPCKPDVFAASYEPVGGSIDPRIAELEAENKRLREDLLQFAQLLADADHVSRERFEYYGLCDQIDNNGRPYPSQWSAELLVKAVGIIKADAALKGPTT